MKRKTLFLKHAKTRMKARRQMIEECIIQVGVMRGQKDAIVLL